MGIELKKGFLMTIAERKTFEKLRDNIKDKYEIFPQICVQSLLTEKAKETQGSRWEIIDFLICDKKYYRPVMIIELDDITHDEEKRKMRDQKLNKLLKTINLPIWRLKNSKNFSRFEINISKQIDFMIKTFSL